LEQLGLISARSERPSVGSLVGVIWRSTLPGRQRDVLQSLVLMVEGGEVSVWATMEQIAERSAFGLAAVRTALGALEAAGLVRREGVVGARLWTLDFDRVMALPRRQVSALPRGKVMPFTSPSSTSSKAQVMPFTSTSTPASSGTVAFNSRSPGQPSAGLQKLEPRPSKTEALSLAHNARVRIPVPCSDPERSPPTPKGADQIFKKDEKNEPLSMEAHLEAELRAKWPTDRVTAALAEARSRPTVRSPGRYARAILEQEDLAAATPRRPQAKARQREPAARPRAGRRERMENNRPRPPQKGWSSFKGPFGPPTPPPQAPTDEAWRRAVAEDQRRLEAELAEDQRRLVAEEERRCREASARFQGAAPKEAAARPEPTERGLEAFRTMSAMVKPETEPAPAPEPQAPRYPRPSGLKSFAAASGGLKAALERLSQKDEPAPQSPFLGQQRRAG